MNDTEFREFRARLADAVTLAINSGKRCVPYPVGFDVGGCNCPLGFLFGRRYPHPVGFGDFILGFDHGFATQRWVN